MMKKKSGMPQEGEIVFCTVTKVQYHSVFARLDEYEHKSGMIHISEISPGRIRNINDYVKEGKVIICKILRINKERGHIDLSLRRVTESQRRAKTEERKQQIIAEKIVQSYAQLHKKDFKKSLAEIEPKLLESYTSLYAAFEDVVENEANLAAAGLDKKIVKDLDVVIKDRIKPKQVSISANLTIESYDPDGVDVVNSIMKDLVKISDYLVVRFLGSGKFKCEIVAPDYKEAEGVYSVVEETLEKGIKGHDTTYELARV